MNPEPMRDPATENYWNGMEAKLRLDVVEFGGFSAQLTANIGKANGKKKGGSCPTRVVQTRSRVLLPKI